MEKDKKVFICQDHDSFYPTGVASVIIAANIGQAKRLLNNELIRIGLKPFNKKPYTLQELNLSKSEAYIINDGNY